MRRGQTTLRRFLKIGGAVGEETLLRKTGKLGTIANPENFSGV